MKKSFEDWTPSEIKDVFGIVENPQTACLHAWLQASASLSEYETQQLAFLRKRLNDYAEKWKEEDLKAYFIIPIVNLIDFLQPQYRAFYEATIEATLIDVHQKPIKLRGRPEFLVAMGDEEPKRPFFFLHEYKPQLRTQKNPQGQLLIAMLTAQAQNADLPAMPLYGLYIVGQNWRFVTLCEKEYGVSKQFDATDEQDLHTIFVMLKFVKNYIQSHVG